MKVIPRLRQVSARVLAPPSRKLSVAALLLASATPGSCTVHGPLDYDDTRFIIRTLQRLGYETGGDFSHGVAIGERVSISANDVAIELGDAVNTLRILTIFLAFTPGRFLLSSSSSPDPELERWLDALRGRFDAEIEGPLQQNGTHLQIRGKISRGGFEVRLENEEDADFAAALILASRNIRDGLRIVCENAALLAALRPTFEVFKKFGGRIRAEAAHTYRIDMRSPACTEYHVPKDSFAVSLWLVTAASVGGEVLIEGLTDISEVEVAETVNLLHEQGCEVTRQPQTIQLTSSGIRGGKLDLSSSIDLALLVASVAPTASSECEVIFPAAFAPDMFLNEMTRAGASVVSNQNRILVQPGWGSDPVTVDSTDPRVLICLAIAGLSRGNLSIQHDRRASALYPRFWRTLEEVVQSSTRHG